MMYKQALKKYFIILLSVGTVVFSGIYIRDPYMLFHKKWFNNEKIYNNMRIQNYGLIKYGDFDSIILGSSMLENTSAKEASEKLNARFVNLSIMGSSFYERSKVLTLAFQYKELKHIIFSLDYKFSKPHDINDTFYPKLYEEETSAKFNIYMTTKALSCIFLNSECDMIAYNLDRPNAWYTMPEHKRRFGGFENWLKYHEEDGQIKMAFTDLLSSPKDLEATQKNYKQMIDTEILPILHQQKTRYSIIIPPYSILWWAKRKNNLDKYFEPYEYLISQTADMSNVKIYWFYDTDMISDIRQYKDLTHYHETNNSKQIDAIKNGTNIINAKNYKDKFKNFKNKINKFNLKKYTDLIPAEYKKTTQTPK